MDVEPKDPKQYELGTLLKTEDDLAGLLAFLAQHGATVTGTPNPKKVALAYPVKKQKEAVFVSCLFSAEPQNAKAFEKDLARRPEILRSILIANPPAEEKRQPGFDAALPRRRTTRTAYRSPAPSAAKPATAPAPGPLSNEALEKKIEEILK
jgi:ribosomal protein S6